MENKNIIYLDSYIEPDAISQDMASYVKRLIRKDDYYNF